MNFELVEKPCQMCQGLGFHNNVQGITCNWCGGSGKIFVHEVEE